MSIPEQFVKQFPMAARDTFVDLQSVAGLVGTDKGGIRDINGFCLLPPWKSMIGVFHPTCAGLSSPVAVLCADKGINEAQEHALALKLFVSMNFINPVKPWRLFAVGTIMLDAEGHLIEGERSPLETVDPLFDNTPDEDAYIAENAMAHIAHVLFVALAFCHCRNVTIKQVAASRQVRRRAERKGELVIEHHQILIDTLRKILINYGRYGDADSSLSKAMHLCRGHFARYGSEHGTGKLFGKHEGTFWIPQHVKGSVERGVITKDYKIGATK